MVLSGHRGLIRAVAFAPDGRTLVSVDNLHLLFWDLPPTLTPAPKGAPPAIRPWARIAVNDAQAIAVDPRGRQVAVAANDGSIRFWNLTSLPSVGLMAVAGAPLGFLSRLSEGERKVPPHPGWQFSDKPTAAGVVRGPKGPIHALVWVNEGLFSGGSDRVVRQWTGPGDSGTVVCMHPSKILSLAVSPDGGLLAIGGDSAEEAPVLIWNLRQKREMMRLRGHTRAVHALNFDGDGKFLASGSQDATVRLWEMPSGHERSLYRGHKESVLSVAFSPDQTMLASAGMDHAIRLWLPFGRREETLETDLPRPIASAAISADTSVVAVARRDGQIQIWRRERAPGIAFEHTHNLKGAAGTIVSLAVAHDGRTVVAAIEGQANQGSVAVWSIPDYAGKTHLEVDNPRVWKASGKLFALAVHGDFLAAVGDGGLQVWNLSKRTLHFERPVQRRKPRAVTFTPDGKSLLVVGGPHIDSWEVATGRHAAESPIEVDNVIQIAIGPPRKNADPNKDMRDCWTVVTADVNGTAKIWDLEPNPIARASAAVQTLQLKERAIMQGHAESITGIAFTSDNRTIATSSEDRTIRLWDPNIGQERAALSGHTDAVYFGVFLPDGKALLTLGREGSLKVWHAPQ
jgi:WD40 repeat protein